MQISVNFGSFVRVDANKNLASLIKKYKPYKIIIKKKYRETCTLSKKKCVSTNQKLRIFVAL